MKDIIELSPNINNKKFCVYGHLCKSTNKWYIGETKFSNNPELRFGKNGWMYLKKNKSGNYKHPKFANAILKYGWENFEHYLLGYYNENEIDEAEKYWINKKNSLEDGYNSTEGGKSTHKLTKENKMKISNKVDQYSIDGKFIRTFDSIKEASLSLGKRDNGSINNCCKGNRKTVWGYVWKYHNGKSFRINSENTNKVFGKHGVATEIIQYDMNGNELQRFKSSAEAGRILNLNSTCINRCCRGERKTYKGYKWKYNL